MIPAFWNNNRRLVPRWRSLRQTLASRELSSGVGPSLHKAGHFDADFTKKIESWRATPNIVSAGELVEAAIVEREEREAIRAARYLLEYNSTASVPLKKVAALLLKRAGSEEDIPSGLEVHPNADKGIWRRRCRLYPGNALAWVELSLHELLGGDRKASHHAMLVAVSLAPNNRHVLRSASRLFLHLGQPDRAYRLLIDCPATPYDPWLIAAELSIAELANRNPCFFNRGRAIAIDGKNPPRQITELSGAIGTLELIAGKRKKARDHFQTSLLDPTGNALAQAEWASPSFGIDLIKPRQFKIGQENNREVGEAVVLHSIRENQLLRAAEACTSWAEAEPYSIRPYEFSSSIYSQLGNYSDALKFAEKGILIRHDAPILANNRAFALANLGRLDEGEKTLRGVRETDGEQWLVSRANRGLIAIRRGQVEAGRAYYHEAIEGFRKANSPQGILSAKAYLARELVLAAEPDGVPLLREVRKEMERTNSKRSLNVVEEAERLLALRSHSQSPSRALE